MSSLKSLLYFWNGYNYSISEKIHLYVQSPQVIHFWRDLSYYGCMSWFPAHFLFICLMMSAVLYSRQNKDRLELSVRYIKVIALLMINLGIGFVLVEGLKRFFAYPRPYCFSSIFQLNDHMDWFLGKKPATCGISSSYSFPSGHTVYISLLVASFWRVLNKYLKTAGALLIAGVGLSRVILGSHFIADVVYGFLLAAIIVCPIGRALLNHYFPDYEDFIRKVLKHILNRFSTSASHTPR